MKLVKSESQNVFENLALEEQLFYSQENDYVFIYKNKDSIVLGRNQNLYKEINSRIIKEDRYPIARRFSGGGTVFHDLGNINLSIITNDKSTIDYFKFYDILYDWISNELNISNLRVESNSLFIEEKKISGAASHKKHDRKLIHCTLLCYSNLELIDQVLANRPIIISKCISSNEKLVGNLSDHIENVNFEESLVDYIEERYKLKFEKLSSKNLNEDIFDKAIDTKWRFYKNSNFELNYKGLHLEVKSGLVKELSLRGSEMHSYYNIPMLELIRRAVIEPKELSEALSL